MRDTAGDHDPVRVEEVDQAGQHLTQSPTGRTNEQQRIGVAVSSELDDVPRLPHVESELGGVAHQRGTTGQRLKAVLVAAGADDVSLVGDVDVADVACRSGAAAVDAA